MKVSKLIQLILTGYDLLLKGTAYLPSPLLLVIRLYWGWAFFQTGLGKLRHLGDTTEFFQGLGLPFPGVNAAMAGTTEMVGGLLLLLGLASRLTTIPLIVTMIVAYLTADIESVKNLFSEPDKFLAADPFLFLFASVLVFVFGPGAFSLDHLIGPKIRAGQAAVTPEPAKPFVPESARAIAH